jgi:hypothetical protein
MVYSYRHPETEKIIDIVQGINDKHEYVDEKGVEWKRVFYAPSFSIDSTPDITTEKGFMKYTANKKGTFGDVIKLSEEASKMREAKEGFDSVKQKGYNEYRRKHGYAHKQEKQEKIQKELATKGIEVTY